LTIFPLLRDALKEAHDNISSKRAFMGPVKNNGGVSLERIPWLCTVQRVFENCGARFGHVFESDRVTHLSSELNCGDH
jgi:hypothetical protein